MAEVQEVNLVMVPDDVDIGSDSGYADGGSAVIEADAPEDGTEDKTKSVVKDRKKTDPRKFAAVLGTMIHKLMEMLVSSKDQLDVGSAAVEIVREYCTPTMEPYEKKLTQVLSGVAEKMRSGGYAQTNGVPQDILGTLLQADEVYCEVPFCYSEDSAFGEGILWNGIMDVVYRSGYKWHIVDYKTNMEGENLDSKYRAQLDAYIRAFKETTGEDADAMTYHIDVT